MAGKGFTRKRKLEIDEFKEFSKNICLTIKDSNSNVITATIISDGTTTASSAATVSTSDNLSHQLSSTVDNITTECNLSIVSGAVVWASYGRKPSRYLGVVIPSIPRVQTFSPHYKNIYWFGDKNVSKIAVKNINHFLDKTVYEEKDEVPLKADGIAEAIQVICDQYELRNVCKPETIQQFILWVEEKKKKNIFSHCNYNIPENILKRVETISNNGIEIDPEDGPSRRENVQIINFAIDFEERDPKSICLGCREVTTRKQSPHPLVEGFLCRNCHMRVMKNYMVLRLNQNHFRYCFLCGWLYKYIFCTNCKRVICRTCMMFWFQEEVFISAAKNAFRWTCIFCVQHNETSKLVALDDNDNNQVHPSFEEETHWPPQSDVNLPDKKGGPKPALRVLSLFDGISTGMLALEKLGVRVEKYFASEIDDDAIMVTQRKFGDSVEHIGDVKEITSESIKQFLPIHLLIGGSPCNDLSRVNHARKGLTDLNGSGWMVFEFYRVMKLIDDVQGHPRTFYYLFENVSSMDINHKNTISRFFESSPICIDAKFMAAMSRPRLFWGNIPQMGVLAKEFLLNARDDNECILQDHLTPNLGREATVRKIRTITTNTNSLVKNDGTPQVVMAGEASMLSVTEIEKIFGFPEHYTDVMNLTPNTRRRLLGKAWCVQVIQALFRPLAKVFQNEEDPLGEFIKDEIF